jgi:hypothetical protein
MNIYRAVVILCFLLSISSNVFATEWSHEEIRAVGKSLISMSGFYVACGKKEFVEVNTTAVRWASFMGFKYLIVAGIENEQKQWAIRGTNGTLIEDPTTSEKSMEVEFSKKTCEWVKNQIDSQYNLANDYISGSYKLK